MTWTQSGNIKGASGVPGASGASGSPGASGIPGASGASGASGAAGTTTWSGITDKPAVIAAGVDAAAARNVISAEYTGNKNQPNGFCGLDASGLVPSSNLPSFVDDVVEAANLAAFPATGESGKIYTALDTNKVYRWGGSSYTEISPSPGSTDAVPEGSTNLYYTAARADGRITAAVGSTVQAYSATLTTYAGKTAPTGAVVGTTDTQTLTNKDLSGSSNTFPAFIKRSVQTITAPTTLGASGATDYVTLCSESGDSFFNDVVLLLHAEGSNGSTTFTDSSSSPKTLTSTGNAQISTAQSKFGSSSMYFDGSGDSVVLANPSTAFGSTTGNFTVEAFFRMVALPPGDSGGNERQIIGQFNWPDANNGWVIYAISTGIQFYLGSGSATTAISGTKTWATNTWYHVAVVRSGTSIKIYVDGSEIGSGTSSTAIFANNTLSLTIGADSGADVNALNGYVDEVRITKAARYTANFTPPTAAFPDVSGTLGTPTLPSASSASTNRYSFRNIAPSATTVIIGASGSQPINGATGGYSLAWNSTVELISDGASGWYSL